MNLQQEDMMNRRNSVVTPMNNDEKKYIYDGVSPHAQIYEEKASIKVPSINKTFNFTTQRSKTQILLEDLPLPQTNEILPIWAAEAVYDLKATNIEYSNGNEDTSSDSEEFSIVKIFNNTKKLKSEHDMIEEVVRSQHVNEINEDDVTFQKQIGYGNFGAVYKAKWEGNTVAVKQFNNLTWEEMIAEIILASSLP
eukprot:720228_1